MSGEVLVVGLGAMGFGMATAMVAKGLKVYGMDVVAETEERFAAAGGHRIGDRDAAMAEIGIAVIVVINAAQTEAVLFSEGGLAETLRPGSVVVSSATFGPGHAVDFEARLKDRGLLYLDAPISGGAARAAEGTLSIMASGSPEAFGKARPALNAMAASVFELGDRAGAGSAMKIVNQLLAGVHVAATAEAMAFGIGQGIAPETMIDVISRSAGNSWMFENRAPFIAAGDYRPHSAVDIFVKDLGIVTETARSGGQSVPIAETALARFREASTKGLGSEGDVALAKIYAEEGGIALPGTGKG